jgi:putative glutamine amidotransferase
MTPSAMTRPPVIGLTSYAEPASWAAWHAPAALLPLNYAGQVTAAGGVPVLLPPVPGVEAAVGRLDGVILTGGGDIDPAAYGAQPHPRTGRVDPARDRAELAVLAAAMAAGLPVLGICRGLQILNTACGGTLHQHLADLPGAAEAGHTPEPGTFGSHPVQVAPGSRLAQILGRDGRPGGPALAVPTAHHQAIDKLGDGLVATAWAADGVIEAVEPASAAPGQPFLLAVQWHPEAGDDPRLLAALVAAARDRAAERAPPAEAPGHRPLDSRA